MDFHSLFSPELLAASIRIATPIILAAMGGLLCIKARIFNIALEGFMLISSFFAIVAIQFLGGSAWIGLGAGILAGIITSLIYSYCVIKLKTDQVITSIGINVLALGITAYLLKIIFDTSGTIRPSTLIKIENIEIPFLVNVPFLGEVLGKHSPVVYLSFLVVIVTHLLLMKTPFGLAVQSVGENPDAARTAGIKPENIRFLVITWSGALSGLAGAYLSSVLISQFVENMTQGRGFTAFIAIVFGAINPFYTFLAALLFGFSEALGIRIEIIGAGFPSTILKMFPYVLSILVLVVSSIVHSRRKVTMSLH